MFPEALRELVDDILGKILSDDDHVGGCESLDLVVLTCVCVRCNLPCDIERVLCNEFIPEIDIDDLVGLACSGKLRDGSDRCPCGNDTAVYCSVQDSLTSLCVVEVAGCEIIECDSVETENSLDC